MARIPNNMTEMLYIIGHGNEYVDTGIHLVAVYGEAER